MRVVAAVVRDPTLLRIELAFLGFNMAEFATWIAILVYAYGRGGAAAAGIVALIQLIPAGLVAPFGAFAGDRFRRDRVLFAGYLVQAAALGVAALALSADASIAVIYAFATVAAASFTFTRPTQAALLPSVTRTPEDLTAANAVAGLAEGAGVFAGPLTAGVLLTHSEPATVFAVFAVVTAVNALLVARLRVDPEAVTPKERMDAGDVFAETLGGFRMLRRERSARLLVLMLSAGGVVVGALDVLFVAVAIDLLDKGEGWAGFLNSAFGLGGIVGAGLSVLLVGRRRLTPPLAGGAFLFGTPIAAVGAAPAVTTAPVLLAASGAGRSLAYVAGSTLLQRIAPDEVLARVFGILEGLTMFALALGSVAASILIEAFGISTALVVVGAFVPAIVLLLWAPLLSIDRGAEAPDEEALALLRAIPIFAPLPAPAIERLLAHVGWITVPAGTIVIREGAVGDRFYVIGEGAVDITRGDRQLARRVPGDFFGEIALLRDVPRTATVTAVYPLRLLTLEREPFLEAVTGHPQSREHAEAGIDEQLMD
jgi:MFS family permease